jgi:hypothetical protein
VIRRAQTSATARRNGKPLILRRDFDAADGGEAGRPRSPDRRRADQADRHVEHLRVKASQI